MSKTITRKYIQRITRNENSTSIRRNSGGGGGGGGVSQYWVDDNYVSKEFFNRLFEIHDENGDPILPNDVETEIDNIQAMFGFWTNAYLSALGQNEGGGGAELTLASLADVAVQGVTDGQALVWSASQGKWVPGEGGGGLDPTAMWAELATTGTQQINKTHLTTALADYLPLAGGTMTSTSLVTNMNADLLDGHHAADFALASAISDMATQTWVSTNYLTKTDANNTYLSIAFFRALFRAYTSGGSEVVPNGGSTSTIDNIKAMFGFWTNSYLSALGNNPGGASLTLSSLSDVSISGATAGQVLTYRNGTWRNETPQGGGTDMQTVWQELAATGTQQINASHLTTALADYATQTWVSQNYLGINDPVASAAKLSTPRTLWGQPFDGTANVKGTISSDYFMLVDSSSNPYLRLSVGSYNWYIEAYSDGIYMGAGNKSNSLMFDSSGNIGIATYTPAFKLDVNGDAHATTLTIGTTYRGSIESGHITSGSTVYESIVFKPRQTVTDTNDYLGFYRNQNGILFYTHVDGNTGSTELFSVRSNSNIIFAYGTRTATAGQTQIWGREIVFCTRLNGTDGGRLRINNEGNVGINTSTLTYRFNVDGQSYFTGNVGIGVGVSSSYALRVAGIVRASTGVYSEGYVTALSDIRHKDIRDNVNLTVSEVANAPAVKFLWKDRRQEGLQVGSIAQYWQKVLPEAIVEAADGELTMSYGVIALLSSIATARKVEDHERRIAELERENKLLKEQLNAA